MSNRRLAVWERLSPSDTERAKVYVIAGLKAAETRRSKGVTTKELDPPKL